MSAENKVFFFNGNILRVTDKSEVIENGYLLVENGKIIEFGAWDNNKNSIPADAEVVDLGGKLLTSGLINSHNHVAMTLFRGLGDDMALMEWLNKLIFPVEKNLSYEWVKWGTLLGCIEMIRSGTIMVNDMYLFMDAAEEAFLESGLRAALGEGVFDFPTPSLGTPEEGLDKVRRLITKWKEIDLVEPVVVAHSGYTCSKDLLLKVRAMADEFDVPMHIHLAESEHEVEIVQQAQNMRPVEYLDSLGMVDNRLLAAHMVHLSADEIKLVSDKGGHILHCPESNMKLASGFAPIGEFLNSGINVCLGTDGCASNNNLDMFREMSFAAKIHKGHSGDPVAVNCDDVLRMSTINGAKAFGVDNITGSIEVGKSADLIVVDFNQAHMRPVYNYASHLVYAASGADVTDNMVAGRWLMKDREVKVINEQKVFEKIEEISAEIKTIIANGNI